MTRRRATLGLALLLVAATASGCGGETSSTGSSCSTRTPKVIEERPVDVAYRGPLLDSTSLPTDPAPRLVVQVTNTQPSVERIRLAFDREDALDIDLPAGSGCSHPAVFSFAYDLPPGPVAAELDLQGAASTSTIDLPESGTTWAVVQVQSERDWGDLTTYDERPMWG